MSRRVLLAGALVAAVVVVVLLIAGGGASNGYVVRAIFDSGGFMVKGEQVRIAGANVGTIKSVGVTMPGETVAYENGEAVAVPGKAVIEMEMTRASAEALAKRIAGRMYQGRPLNAWVPAMNWED